MNSSRHHLVLTQAIKEIITKAANPVSRWVERAHTSEQYVLVVLKVWQSDRDTANIAKI